MPIVEDVLDYLMNDLKIKISKKNKDLVLDKFYPDIKDKLYWSFKIEYSFYEGIVSKEEYEKFQTLPPDTEIVFAEIDKYVYDECQIKDIPFTNDIEKMKKLFDKGFRKSETYYDLMTNDKIEELLQKYFKTFDEKK